jgi:hypothetical protein
MAYTELKKVFDGDVEVNYLKVLDELQGMVLSVSKKFDINLDADKLDELRAMLFQSVWSLPRPIAPNIGFKHCFSKAKRFIYALMDERDKQVPLDLGISEDITHPEDVLTRVKSHIDRDCFEFEFVDQVEEHLQGLLLHPKIKNYLVSFFSTERDWLYDVAISNTVLGSVVKSALFRNRFYATYTKNFNDALRSHELFDEGLEFMSPREKEILLGGIMVKLNKKHRFKITQIILPQYILMGDLFLVMTALFGNKILMMPDRDGTDIKGLLADVPVYSFLERQQERGESLDSAIQSGIKRFGNGYRPEFNKTRSFQCCWTRVRGILDDYEQFAKGCVRRFDRELRGIKSE